MKKIYTQSIFRMVASHPECDRAQIRSLKRNIPSISAILKLEFRKIAQFWSMKMVGFFLTFFISSGVLRNV